MKFEVGHALLKFEVGLLCIREEIHFNPFITRFVTVLDITRFKDGSQKCIDYIEK